MDWLLPYGMILLVLIPALICGFTLFMESFFE